MGLRDLKNNQTDTQSLHPATRTVSANGTGVDLQGAKSAMAVLHVGAWGSGSWTPSLEESDASGSGYAAVAAADLEGAFVAVVDATNENASQRVGYKGTKRYIRLVMTTASSPASLPCAGSIAIEPNAKPAA